jgi:gliding motility-associated transport system permease protein
VNALPGPLQGLGAVGLIARRELAAYFASLSGYVILAAHLLVSGLLFNVFAVGSAPRLSQEVLEQFFYFSSGMAMVSGILLAMRLVAEERQLQTLVLLRTAPVSERQVVWGKFLSALAFLGLALLLSLYMPALIFVHGKVSLLQIAVGYLGLLLIGAACIAITLLASVWSATQLMAGVVGGLMVALLVICWMLARVTEEPLKELFVQLALHNVHFRALSTGTLHLRDLAYYLGVIVLFLEASVRSLEAWRWRE